MPVTFAFPQLARATGAAGPAERADPGRHALTEESLKTVGFELASAQLPTAYQFSRMGGWNVTFRASVCRITFFKLLGTGVAAALMTASPHIGSYTSWSLTMSAAVNIVACGHYYYIWQCRLQTYRSPKYDNWMAKVGRAPVEDKALLAAEEEHDKRAIFFQEVTVDGLRYSDWLATLVLMSLDLGHLRTYLFYATKGAVPEMPIAKEWVATLQAVMMLFASVWRFYVNEGRSVLLADGSHRAPSLLTTAIALGSLLASMVAFVLVVWALLDGLPAGPTTFPAHVDSDIFCLRVLVLSWLGYPVVAVIPRLGHWGLPGSYYSAAWSTFKDVAYAFLDVTSKGGLAIYFVLKASWVTGATEDALVAAGKAALNVTA